MAYKYNTEGILNGITRNASIPRTSLDFASEKQLGTLDDGVLLDIANEEMIDTIMPILLRVQEEFFVTYKDFDIIADKSGYEIPSQAIGGALRDIKLYKDNIIVDVPRLSVDNFNDHDNGYYIQGNYINLISNNNYTDYTLRMYYHKRPNALVLTSECVTISSIDIDINPSIFLFDDDETIPSTFEVGESIEIIQSKPQFNKIGDTYTITDITGNQITVAEPLSADITTGMNVSIKDTACVAQIPFEMYPLLIQAVVVRLMMIMGDMQGYQVAVRQYQDLVQTAIGVVEPRVSSDAPIINGGAFL